MKQEPSGSKQTYPSTLRTGDHILMSSEVSTVHGNVMLTFKCLELQCYIPSLLGCLFKESPVLTVTVVWRGWNPLPPFTAVYQSS